MAEEEKITAEETPETTETVEETAETAASEEISETDVLKQEVESLKDKMIRHAAEFDNFKKRTAKEREDLYAMAVCDTVEKVLPVKDNLERAISAADGAESGMLEGVTMILKQLDDVFTALGVEKIKTEGEQFDPNLHEAVMHTEDPAYGENVITDCYRKG